MLKKTHQILQAPFILYIAFLLISPFLLPPSHACPPPPDPPTLTGLEALSPSAQRLTWSQSYGASEYRIYRSTNGSSFSYLQTAYGLTADIGGLSAGTHYWYRVTAWNSSGESGYLNTVDNWTLPSAPGTPSVSAPSSGMLRISWGSVGSATNYKVYRSDSPTGSYGYRGQSNGSLSWDDTSLPSGTHYCYKISAVNGGGESALSTNPGDNWTRPAVPGQPSVQPLSTTAIRASWSAVTGAASYTIYGSDGGPFYEIASDVTGFSGDYQNLSPGTQYFCKIVAVNTGGSSGESPVGSGWTLPDAPSISSVNSLSSAALQVNWGSVTSAANYKIYRCETTPGTFTYRGQTGNLSYGDGGLPAGTRYYYKVTAINPGGESAQSTAVGGWTLPTAPTISSVNSLSSSALQINWGSVTSATNYKVYRSATEGGSYAFTSQTSSLYYVNNGLSAGTQYFYKVVAVNQGGDSTYSVSGNSWTCPPAPVSLSAIARTSKRFDFSWVDNSSSEIGFRVSGRKQGSGSFSMVADLLPNVTTYFCKDQQFSPATAYEYYVRSYNSGGYSSPSNIVEIDTLDQPLFLETWDAVQEPYYPASYDVSSTGSVSGADNSWVWQTENTYVQSCGFRSTASGYEVGRFAAGNQEGLFSVRTAAAPFDFSTSDTLSMRFEASLDTSGYEASRALRCEIRSETDYSGQGLGSSVAVEVNGNSANGALAIWSSNIGTRSNIIHSPASIETYGGPGRYWVETNFSKNPTSGLDVSYRLYNQSNPSVPVVEGGGSLDMVPCIDLNQVKVAFEANATGSVDDLMLYAATQLEGSQAMSQPNAITLSEGEILSEGARVYQTDFLDTTSEKVNKNIVIEKKYVITDRHLKKDAYEDALRDITAGKEEKNSRVFSPSIYVADKKEAAHTFVAEVATTGTIAQETSGNLIVEDWLGKAAAKRFKIKAKHFDEGNGWTQYDIAGESDVVFLSPNRRFLITRASAVGPSKDYYYVVNSNGKAAFKYREGHPLEILQVPESDVSILFSRTEPSTLNIAFFDNDGHLIKRIAEASSSYAYAEDSRNPGNYFISTNQSIGYYRIEEHRVSCAWMLRASEAFEGGSKEQICSFDNAFDLSPSSKHIHVRAHSRVRFKDAIRRQTKEIFLSRNGQVVQSKLLYERFQLPPPQKSRPAVQPFKIKTVRGKIVVTSPDPVKERQTFAALGSGKVTYTKYNTRIFNGFVTDDVCLYCDQYMGNKIRKEKGCAFLKFMDIASGDLIQKIPIEVPEADENAEIRVWANGLAIQVISSAKKTDKRAENVELLKVGVK